MQASCLEVALLNPFHGAKVDDRAIAVGGTQTIEFPSGIAIPIDIVSSLPHIEWESFVAHKWNTFPHPIVTPDNVQ